MQYYHGDIKDDSGSIVVILVETNIQRRKRRKVMKSSKEKLEYMKKYQKSDEGKCKHIIAVKKYQSKPEIKEKMKEYKKQWNLNNKDKQSISYKKWYKSHPNEDRKHHESQKSDKYKKWRQVYRKEHPEKQYSTWAIKVKNRDKICKICDSKNNLHAHHIKPKSQYPELSKNIENGITLCSECHIQYHIFNKLS